MRESFHSEEVPQNERGRRRKALNAERKVRRGTTKSESSIPADQKHRILSSRRPPRLDPPSFALLLHQSDFQSSGNKSFSSRGRSLSALGNLPVASGKRSAAPSVGKIFSEVRVAGRECLAKGTRGSWFARDSMEGRCAQGSLGASSWTGA